MVKFKFEIKSTLSRFNFIKKLFYISITEPYFLKPFVKSAMRHLMLELDKVAESDQTELRYNPSPCAEPEPESLWHLTRDKSHFSLESAMAEAEIHT